MPEGPEVALLRDQIKELCEGSVFEKIDVLTYGKYTRLLQTPEGASRFVNQKVLEVCKKGKLLYLRLEKETFTVTLGLYGSLTEQVLPHCRLRLCFSNGTCLHYSDPRNFGNLKFMSFEELDKKKNQIGIDLMEIQPTLEEVKLLRKHNQKTLLKVMMNQKPISGCGNYLKSESFYETRLSPYEKIKDIPDALILKYLNNLKTIMHESHALKGLSFKNFVDSKARRGFFKDRLKIHRKKITAEGDVIVRIVTDDKRFTYWVPHLQKSLLEDQ